MRVSAISPVPRYLSRIDKPNKIKHVLHVIVDLEVGGAELMLKRLIESHQSSSDFRHTVVSLTGVGKIGQQLQLRGVDVQSLGMRSAVGIPRVLWQLIRLVREVRPHIVQTWMYHANLLGGVAAHIAGSRRVIWSLRGSTIPQKGISMTRIVVIVGSWLSSLIPNMIVCCAESVRVAHAQLGYDLSKLIVIPNGYDLEHFSNHAELRQQARSAFGFGEDDVVVGIVGRFDPLKDYRNFVLAAAMLASRIEHVKFLMVGRGIDSTNTLLMGWLATSGFIEKFVLTGERNDIPACLAAMDIFCLSSRSEGFPNVVCEAMAMNLPCVVTDVGDAAEIVSKTGIVVPRGDPNTLAIGLWAMIEKGRAEWIRLGELARRQIEKRYAIANVSIQYESLYKQISEFPRR